MGNSLRSTDEDAHVSTLVELLQGSIEHDGFKEAEEKLNMIDLNDLGKDNFNGWSVWDEAGSLPRQVGDDELDVGAHHWLIVLLPVIRVQQGIVDDAILLIHLGLQLEEDSQNLQAEVEKVALVLDGALEEVEHLSLQRSLVLTVGFDVIES